MVPCDGFEAPLPIPQHRRHDRVWWLSPTSLLLACVAHRNFFLMKLRDALRGLLLLVGISITLGEYQLHGHTGAFEASAE